MSNTLFYSNYCKYSNNLIKELKSNNILYTFQNIICIDDITYDKIPKYLKTVPTIIIPEYDKPIEYENALIWLKMKQKNKNQENKIQKKMEDIINPEEVIVESKEGELNNKAFMGFESNPMSDFELIEGDNRKEECLLDQLFKVSSNEPINENGGLVQNVDNNFDKKLEEIQKIREMDNKFAQSKSGY